MQCLSVPLFVWKFKFQVSFYQHSNVSQLAKRRLMLYDIVCSKMMHVYTDYVTYDAVGICIFHKEFVINSPKIAQIFRTL